jgi:copper chaperone CopZ
MGQEAARSYRPEPQEYGTEKDTKSFKARSSDGEVSLSESEAMMLRHRFMIEGMACQHCVMSVEKALDALDGVDRFSVRVGFVEVQALRSLNSQQIATCIEAEGYRVTAKL